MMKAVLVVAAVCILCAPFASADGKDHGASAISCRENERSAPPPPPKDTPKKAKNVSRFIFDTMASMMNSMASGMNYMMGKMTDTMNCAADVMMLKGCQTNNTINIVQPVPVTTVRTQMLPDTSKTSTAFQAEPVSATQKTSLRVYPCDKYQSINVIAHESSVVNKRTGSCNRQDRNNPDALVIRLCTAPDVTTWKKGAKVMDYCDRIPLFSAVATFVNNHHYTGGYSGIFAGCLKNGFKMILQTCQNAPSVIHITLDAMNNVDYNTDPVNYYILNW